MNEMDLSAPEDSVQSLPAAARGPAPCETSSWSIDDPRWDGWLKSQPSRLGRGVVMVIDGDRVAFV